ncbi:unnamed protein product [Coffea canephora]|uniref:Uncharacterized protein n=1 Tax=Coffea canephora TaxID=49390 RepID=A0A068UMH9_COFCA|nr:unnamed protein product [Coffea canephora]
MAGRRERLTCDEMGEIKKGPWKAEEDEVLINHVKKYGPRDWSSIRSKGLLQRTGKSCRLRWVNKLRPNLKNGVKFSAEEERIVIDLQAQFGNKWAKIATYLPGRTDNDVKNFWSSRQKRLARILQTPASSSSSSSNRSQRNKHVPAIHDVPPFEASKFSSSSEEDSLPKSQSCLSSYTVKSLTVEMEMVPLPELMHPNTLNYEQSFLPPEFDLIEKKPCIETLSQLPFPQIPNFQSEFALSLEHNEVVTRLGDPNYLEAFGSSISSELGNVQLPIMPTCFESERRSTQIAAKCEIGNPVTPDSFVDDFPIDIFDHIEPLPSPLDW